MMPAVDLYPRPGGEQPRAFVMRGRDVPAWEGRRRAEALRRVKAIGRSSRPPAPCVLCRESIDYDLKYPHPQSCSVQHLKSRFTHPHLTWDPTNWAPAHLVCNQRHGPGGRPLDGLGVVEEW